MIFNYSTDDIKKMLQYTNNKYIKQIKPIFLFKKKKYWKNVLFDSVVILCVYGNTQFFFVFQSI